MTNESDGILIKINFRRIIIISKIRKSLRIKNVVLETAYISTSISCGKVSFIRIVRYSVVLIGSGVSENRNIKRLEEFFFFLRVLTITG